MISRLPRIQFIIAACFKQLPLKPGIRSFHLPILAYLAALTFALTLILIPPPTPVTAQEAPISYPIVELGNCSNAQECYDFCAQEENIPTCWSWSLFVAGSRVLGDSTLDTTKPRTLSITFPIPDLGNCANVSSCKLYCSKAENKDACLAYGKKVGILKESSEPEVESLKETAQKELGCSSIDDCRRMCNKPANYEKCQTFTGKYMESVRTAQAASESSVSSSCEYFCTDFPDKCRSGTDSTTVISIKALQSNPRFVGYPACIQAVKEYVSACEGPCSKNPLSCLKDQVRNAPLSCSNFCKDLPHLCSKDFTQTGTKGLVGSTRPLSDGPTPTPENRATFYGFSACVRGVSEYARMCRSTCLENPASCGADTTASNVKSMETENEDVLPATTTTTIPYQCQTYCDDRPQACSGPTPTGTNVKGLIIQPVFTSYRACIAGVRSYDELCYPVCRTNPDSCRKKNNSVQALETGPGTASITPTQQMPYECRNFCSDLPDQCTGTTSQTDTSNVKGLTGQRVYRGYAQCREGIVEYVRLCKEPCSKNPKACASDTTRIGASSALFPGLSSSTPTCGSDKECFELCKNNPDRCPGFPKKYISSTSDWKSSDVTEGWTSLKFNMDNPQYYQYQYKTGNYDASSSAHAWGDLSGDELPSVFKLEGKVDPGQARTAPSLLEHDYEEPHPTTINKSPTPSRQPSPTVYSTPTNPYSYYPTPTSYKTPTPGEYKSPTPSVFKSPTPSQSNGNQLSPTPH